MAVPDLFQATDFVLAFASIRFIFEAACSREGGGGTDGGKGGGGKERGR